MMQCSSDYIVSLCKIGYTGDSEKAGERKGYSKLQRVMKQAETTLSGHYL